MKPDETDRLVRLQACLKDIKTGMTQTCLLLNSGKTEVVLFGLERFREKLSSYIVTLDQGVANTVPVGTRSPIRTT